MKLRSENGCPWDKVQTHQSLIPYLKEETYEVIDALVQNDSEQIKEELGDLLFQIIFHAQIAQEQGQFDFNDIANAINQKMVRRHPHIFADAKYASIAEQKEAWQAIKLQEKLNKQALKNKNGENPENPENPENTEQSTWLSSVKEGQSAEMVAIALQKRAAEVNFDWDNSADVLAKVQEEFIELEEAIKEQDDPHIEEEFGDILFALMNLARHLKIDPETALRKTNHKFKTRFTYIENKLKQQNRHFANSNLDEMEALWDEAKIKL